MGELNGNFRNSDRIPLRVGQVWREFEPCKADYEIVFWRDTSDLFVCWEIGFGPSFEAFAPVKFDSMELVSDPIWGDMSEWRIVTEQEKKDHHAPPKEAMHVGDDGRMYPFNTRSDVSWDRYSLWFIPRDLEWPEEKPSESESKPQYRLFEIDWTRGTLTMVEYMIGAKVGGYRIFGYTDSENWDKPGDVSYHNFPCNALSNHRYAIGRLEQ